MQIAAAFHSVFRDSHNKIEWRDIMSKSYLRGFYPLVRYQDKSVFTLHESHGDKTGAITKGMIELDFREYYPRTFQRSKPAFVQREVADEILSGNTTVDLKRLYTYAIEYEERFLKVTNEVADELFTDLRYQKLEERQMYRYEAQYSLDVDNGIENAVIFQTTGDPEDAYYSKERHCQLCRALNSLPEIQGRRIEAHFIDGKTPREIAREEGVSKGAVSLTLSKGLEAMKKYLQNID